MRRLEDFFASNIGRTLYHYTGIGALLGIVEHQKAEVLLRGVILCEV